MIVKTEGRFINLEKCRSFWIDTMGGHLRLYLDYGEEKECDNADLLPECFCDVDAPGGWGELGDLCEKAEAILAENLRVENRFCALTDMLTGNPDSP